MKIFVSFFRTIIWFFYFFGYLIVHYGALKKGRQAMAAGDRATVDALTAQRVPVWCNTLLKMAGVTITVQGKENIPTDRPCVFVANHRGYYDIPIMLTQLDAVHGMLAKTETDKIPLVRGWMRLLGCVFVDRDDVRASMKALNAGIAEVESGHSFTIFPEGTRYKGAEGDIGEFKGGAFRIALKTGAPIVPVALSNTRDIMENNHYLMCPAHVTVHILPPIETKDLTRAAQKDLPLMTQQLIEAALKHSN